MVDYWLQDMFDNMERCERDKAEYVDIEDYQELEAKLTTYEKTLERAIADVNGLERILKQICKDKAFQEIEMIKFRQGFAFRSGEHSLDEMALGYFYNYINKEDY